MMPCQKTVHYIYIQHHQITHNSSILAIQVSFANVSAFSSNMIKCTAVWSLTLFKLDDVHSKDTAETLVGGQIC